MFLATLTKIISISQTLKKENTLMDLNLGGFNLTLNLTPPNKKALFEAMEVVENYALF